MNDDYIKRPEFEHFRDHVDNQYVELANGISHTEVSMLNKITTSNRWLIGIFMAVVGGGISIWFDANNGVHEAVKAERKHTDERTSEVRKLSERALEQTLSNSVLLGASIERSDLKDEQLAERVQAIKENTELQLRVLREEKK